MVSCKPDAPVARRTGVTALVKGAPAHAGTADLKGPPSMSSPTTWDADEAVTSLYAAHYRSLVRMAALLLRDGGEAEEVVQDAFVRLYGALDRIEDDAATPAYLRSIVMNGARSKLRHRQVVRRHPPTPDPHAEAADAGAVLHEDQREVIEALRTLPTRQRECLVLRYYGGCSEAEIASTLGIARGTVKSSISRAMAAMSQRLEASR